MKRIIMLILSVFLGAVVFSQETRYYYSNNKRSEVKVNKEYLLVYFDITKITKEDIHKRYNVAREVTLSKDKSRRLYCCEILLDNTIRYEEVLTTLKSRE